MASLTFRITGMQSIYCAQTLQAALNAIPGVRAYVSFKKRLAEVSTRDNSLPVEKINETICTAGYCVAPLTERSGAARQRSQNNINP